MKSNIVAIVAVVIIIGGAILLTRGSPASSKAGNSAQANNVTVVDGKQIIDVQVKGGYQPKSSTAKAGIPTVLRFTTDSTFDCSSEVRIPSMGISQNLPQTGKTDVAIGTPTAGPLKGVCVMGMYSFEVDFQG